MKNRVLLAAGVVVVLGVVAGLWYRGTKVQPRTTSESWPNYNAANWFHVVREAGTETCAVAAVGFSFNQCARQCDLLTSGSSCLLRVHYSTQQLTHVDPATAGVKVKYFVHGVAISEWLDPPFQFTLAITNPALASLQDGMHDISVDVQSGTQDRKDYRFIPMLVHLHRGGTFATSALVPLTAEDYMYSEFFDSGYGGSLDMGSWVLYVDPATRHMAGHPIVDTNVTPWHTYTPTSDLYQVELAPHGDLFVAAQMWWMFPAGDPDAGKIYARAMVPKYDEDHPGLYPQHRRFPYRDGPRGVAWSSPYVTGQVLPDGTFYFVEAGGPLREIHPNGEMETIAGWRVAPGKFPIFLDQPVEVVHQNMELVGNWLEGQHADQSGFRTPLDVAMDPRNSKEFYVVGFDDHCIWKVVEHDGAPADVSVFAGDVAHTAGYTDGVGHAARFNGPTSVVFDPICDCLYVSDQNNDAIRKITRAAVVTTFEGRPGMWDRIIANGNPTPGQPQYSAPTTNRSFAHYTVDATQAASGMRPDIFQPMTVRVDSFGFVLVSDNGFGSIRRIHPLSHVTTQFANMQAGHWDGQQQRGWTWFDVDRYGNSGELNSVYSCVFQVGAWPDGEATTHPNEFYGYVSPNNGAGGLTHYVFEDWQPNPDGWGPRTHTDPPHYCWNVAVDPRGGVYLSGGGEHGQTYLRMRKPTDPIPADYANRYYRGKVLWKSGGDQQFGSTYGPSFILKFGSEGHNYLGFTDAWDVTPTMTDAEIISRFELSRFSGQDLTDTVNFIRLNSGIGSSDMPPPPLDTTPPTVTVSIPTTAVVGIAIQMTAMASDNVGVVSGTVQFPGSAATAISYPYAGLWTPTAPGTFTISFTAKDAAGNTGPASGSVTVTPPIASPDPCVADPLLLSVQKWPTTATGPLSLSWRTNKLAKMTFEGQTTPWKVTVVDERHCTATQVKK